MVKLFALGDDTGPKITGRSLDDFSPILNEWMAGPWSGMSPADAKRHYLELYDLGTLSTVHFGIDLQPLERDSLIARADLPIFRQTIKLPWLAQSIDLSVLDLQTDSVMLGHYTQNYITGNSSGELAIPFIETRQADILNSALLIKNIMLNKDGTQALPADYLMRLNIHIFDRNSRSTKHFETEHIVALQTSGLQLDPSAGATPGIVNLTFIKTYGMKV